MKLLYFIVSIFWYALVNSSSNNPHQPAPIFTQNKALGLPQEASPAVLTSSPPSPILSEQSPIRAEEHSLTPAHASAHSQALASNTTFVQKSTVSIANPFDDEVVKNLQYRYKNKFVCATVGNGCEVYLCGTLHVAKSSADFVIDAISSLKPDYVVVELCDSRIDSLCEADAVASAANYTMSSVLQMSNQEKTLSKKLVNPCATQ